MPLKHPVLTLGYRNNTRLQAYQYFSGHAVIANNAELFRYAYFLIAECAYRPEQFSEAWPHLNPEADARIAVEAGVKQLALTHFDARLYTTYADREESEIIARKIFPATFAARDDQEIDL
jgi:ribonuclease BN (tRNA processing enzyme)